MVNKYLKLVSVAALIVGLQANCSFALLNQSQSAFLSWCATRPALKGTKRETYQQTDFSPAFGKDFVLTGSKVGFGAWMSEGKNPKVIMEALFVEEPFSDKKMVTLIEKIYGKSFLQEVMSSKILFDGKAKTQTDGLTNFLVLKNAKFGVLVEKYDGSEEGNLFRIIFQSPASTDDSLEKIKSGSYFVD